MQQAPVHILLSKERSIFLGTVATDNHGNECYDSPLIHVKHL
jgi:hypothetical protein